jgi:ribosomal protein S18 acetylase RimI-like enzyme
MSTTLIEVRPAKAADATAVALTHDEAWRAAYQGNRARSLHFEGEIYELYLRPEFQGLGFGRRLFAAAKRDLAQSGLKSMVVWALSDNDPATEFYRALGGRMVARSSERFGPKSLDKVAFAWTN